MEAIRALVAVSGDPDSLQRGAREVFAQLQRSVREFGLEDEVAITMTGDMGRHDALPMVIVYPETIIYGPVMPENVHHLVEEHLFKGRVVEELRAAAKEMTGKIAWLYAREGTLPAEQRIVLARAGVIDPEQIDDTIIHDGYQALVTVVSSRSPQEVVAEIKKSGLRGRGGAGFPTGAKWGFVAQTAGDKKYVVCNADESEPGTFKDRLVLEGDPHCLIEAMAIAAYAVGADEGYIYVRGEYALAQERLKTAIAQAKEYGFLGKNFLGSGFSFDLHIHSGAGAYICGEETALLESLEGRRGEPRSRPPYPTTNGLWGKPTLINNVETLANVPAIMRNGADWFRGFGTKGSPGTKVYTILGHVNVTGLIEVPMGITLREVIALYGKGMRDGGTFKMAQTGGSAGSIVPASLQDTPMDFDSFREAGVSLGSGALLICNQDTCVVDLAKVLLNFFRRETCGKCTPCRIGTQRAYQILESISEGTANMENLRELASLEDGLRELSNCGLGQTAMCAIGCVLQHFRAEVEAHIRLRVCPTGVCPMRGRRVKAA